MTPEDVINTALADWIRTTLILEGKIRTPPKGAAADIISHLRDAGYYILGKPTVTVEDLPSEQLGIHVQGRFDDTIVNTRQVINGQVLESVVKPEGLIAFTRWRTIAEWMDGLRVLLFPEEKAT